MSLYATGGGFGPPSAHHSDILSVDNPTTHASRTSLIDEIKRRGRACVVSKNYHDAEALYGKGIEILSLVIADEDDEEEDATMEECKKDIAIFYSNRSLVRLSMNKVTEAMNDADLAISNDATYIKAHWRRGQACNAAGGTNEALNSFEKALEIDPSNKALMKEVQIAKEKLKVEQELLSSSSAKDDAHGDPVGIMESSESKEDFIKRMESSSKKSTVAATSTSSTPQSATKTTNTKSTTSVNEHDSTSLFTKSDHVRGYKIRSDGTKTSYFDREIDEQAKKLIGDIAPKKLSENVGNNGNDFAPKPINVEGGGGGGGTSVWNKAGTWEERDVTNWAKETLTASLLSAEYILPDGSPSPGAHAIVSKVSKLEGNASYASVRGKKKYIYEFAITIKWVLTLGNDHTQNCHGEMTFPDVDGTVEVGEGYDIVNYIVDGSTTPSGTGPMLDRFVRDGGLRESIHAKIDEWVKLFRATY